MVDVCVDDDARISVGSKHEVTKMQGAHVWVTEKATTWIHSLMHVCVGGWLDGMLTGWMD